MIIRRATFRLFFLLLTMGWTCESALPAGAALFSEDMSKVGSQNGGLSTSSPLPGMPPVLNPKDLYSETQPNKLSPVVKGFPSLVYVPNSGSSSVDVIDPKTFKIVDHFTVGKQPQHVVPSWDLKTLWVLDDQSNSLTKIDPATGKKKETIPVDDPYNLYFTPDGKFAIVVAEARHRLDFRDPQTMAMKHELKVPCAGVNHMDFSPNGRYAIVSCEFDGKMLKVDIAEQKLLGTIQLEKGAMPQDVRISPDGAVYYVADMGVGGVHEIDGDKFVKIGFMKTGKGAHGLQVSRDSKVLYVSNRGEGSLTLIDFASRKIINKWTIPNGGSPDMGGISNDGKVLWISGRYNAEVYAISLSDGKLLARIRVGKGPHGVCVYPQPGRYSMGHVSLFR